MKFYESAKFKKLNAKWTEKLKKDGFKDQEEMIEVLDIHGVKKEGDRLKTWTTSLFRGRFNQTRYDAQVTYWRLVGQFLHEHSFKNQIERTIWELYTKGIHLSKIAPEVKIKPRTVISIVSRLSKLMLEKAKEVREDD